MALSLMCWKTTHYPESIFLCQSKTRSSVCKSVIWLDLDPHSDYTFLGARQSFRRWKRSFRSKIWGRNGLDECCEAFDCVPSVSWTRKTGDKNTTANNTFALAA